MMRFWLGNNQFKASRCPDELVTGHDRTEVMDSEILDIIDLIKYLEAGDQAVEITALCSLDVPIYHGGARNYVWILHSKSFRS